jgi:hypothetical protein
VPAGIECPTFAEPSAFQGQQRECPINDLDIEEKHQLHESALSLSVLVISYGVGQLK